MALPSGYTRLDYIESSGTQYIDTGFKPNGNSRVVMDFEGVAISQTLALFGARSTNSTNAFGMWVEGGKAQAQYGNVGYNTKPITITNTDRLTYDLNKGVATVGGTTVTFDNLSFASNCSLALLGMNSNGTVDERRASGKLYSAQIYDNGTLVRDFIPCKNASGVIGLWDNVNSVFYANAGTGTFSTGTKHKTLIDGTGYEIKSGSVLIAGTGYDIKKGRTLIGGTGYDISFVTPVGELAVGSSVFMNIQGGREEFIVVHQGDLLLVGDEPTDICSGTWVLKKEVSAFGSYSTLDDMQDNYLPMFDSEIQALLQPIKCCTSGNSPTSTKITIPRTENVVGGDTAPEHSTMDYFANGGSRIAFYSGTAKGWWLSGHFEYVGGNGRADIIDTTGDKITVLSGAYYGLRFLLLLPQNGARADNDFNIIPA